MMERVFLDTNILLDVLEKRDPHVLAAANIFQLGLSGEVRLFASSLSFINCIFSGRKALDYDSIVEKVKLLRSFISVSPMTEVELDLALDEFTRDVEDCLQYYSALSARCDCIVTRDSKHFPKTGIPILSPNEFLDTMK